jgi:hypothetical protein
MGPGIMTNHAQARAEGRAEGIREAAAAYRDWTVSSHPYPAIEAIIALLDAPSGVTQPDQEPTQEGDG